MHVSELHIVHWLRTHGLKQELMVYVTIMCFRVMSVHSFRVVIKEIYNACRYG